MGECEESSVSGQSTLRGPMILAKVITDALENKKRVSRNTRSQIVCINTCLMMVCVVYMYAGREFRLWGCDRASVCLSDEGRWHEEMAARPTAMCLSARQRT